MNMEEISAQRERGEQYGLYGPLAIFSGTANPQLAQEIADRLRKPLGQVSICQYANQNIFARLNESVRTKDVFLIQPTCPGVRNRLNTSGECVAVPEEAGRLEHGEFARVPASVNDNILELLVLIDEGTISERLAKELIKDYVKTGDSPRKIVEEKNLALLPVDELRVVVSEIVGENPRAVEDYRSGKTKAAEYLIGQVLRRVRARASAGIVRELVLEALKEN